MLARRYNTSTIFCLTKAKVLPPPCSKNYTEEKDRFLVSVGKVRGEELGKMWCCMRV